MTSRDSRSRTLPLLAPVESKEAVLFLDAALDDREIVQRALCEHFEVLEAASAAQALEIVERCEVAVLIVDETTLDRDGPHLFQELASRSPRMRAVQLMTPASTSLEQIQDLLGEARFFYFLRKPFAEANLLALVQSAAADWRDTSSGAPGSPVELDAHQATRAGRVLEYARRLAMQNALGIAGHLASQAVEELLEADRGRCFLYDPMSETLWFMEGGKDGSEVRYPVAGLAGFVARTGSSARLARALEDARFLPEIDDPGGSGEARLLAVPVLSARRRLEAVLVAARVPERPPFSDEDLEILELFADQAAMAFGQMALQARIERAFTRSEAAHAPEQRMYRQESLDAHVRSDHRLGAPLRLSSAWVRYAYPIVVVVFLGVIACSAFGTMDQYAAGHAVVRTEGALAVSAGQAGVIEAVHVTRGDLVVAGQPLLSLADHGESKVVRASRDAQVLYVRARPGFRVGQDDEVLALRTEHAALVVTAVLPGHYRPRIDPSMPVRIELDGFPDAIQELVIHDVSDVVLTPEEGRRSLGPDLWDLLRVDAPVLLIRAALPSSALHAEGRSFALHDGMRGRAEVRVGRERLLTALVPALRGILPPAR